jgi:hypothetical protein
VIARLVEQGLPVELACRSLEVSTSGFYAWRSRPSSPSALRREWLVGVIREIYVRSRGTYGSRGLLAELLDRQLPAERINSEHPPADFATRYGFLDQPRYVRLRSLDGPLRPFGPFTELTIRVDELAHTRPDATTVYIVENEITYLAFLPAPDSLVIFGSGYGLGTLNALDWLTDQALVYWGDIDTHGFAILDRLRSRLGNVRSMLMDRSTLLAHRTQWVREAHPNRADLEHLTLHETELYQDLVRGTFGDSLRLEQERVRFSAVQHTI